MARKEEKEQEAVEDAGYEGLGVFIKGQLARVYKVAEHGKRAAEYAEEFAKKKGGEVRVMKRL